MGWVWAKACEDTKALPASKASLSVVFFMWIPPEIPQCPPVFDDQTAVQPE